MPGKHTGPVNMVTAADAEALGFHGAKLAGAERLLADYVAEGHIAGAVSLVARRGNIAQLLAVGHADIESDAPMAADTLFRVFSLTKPVTSVAALMLVERGRVSLDAPVADYIPAFRDIPVFVGEEGGRLVTEPARRPPTVRHLLTQTSGIAGTAMPPREPLTAVYRRARIGDENLTLEETVDKLAEIPLLFHPGEQWRYGVSTDVLARVVESRVGHALRRLFARKHLRAAGDARHGLRRAAGESSPAGHALHRHALRRAAAHAPRRTRSEARAEYERRVQVPADAPSNLPRGSRAA